MSGLQDDFSESDDQLQVDDRFKSDYLQGMVAAKTLILI